VVAPLTPIVTSSPVPVSIVARRLLVEQSDAL
jgi:hypothetical protein